MRTWCAPPKASGAFVWHMEDILEVYQRPYHPDYPVVCLDEASKQLVGEIALALPPVPGQPARIDYEYERKGTCNLFMMCEPLGGWRHVEVTERRTRMDWALCLRKLATVYYPHAKRIILVQDNLNTHDGTSLYETFPPEVARPLVERIEFHPTPKHGSWLNMAETELSILMRQCLNRRIDNPQEIIRQVQAWETERNTLQRRIHWTFTIPVARAKLPKLYPSIENW